MNEQIVQWKKEYGKIYKFNLEDNDVYARALTSNEVVCYADSHNLASTIPSLVILNNVDLKLPGSLIYLTNFIVGKSTITDEDGLIERAILNRQKMDSHFVYEMIASICKIFPYKLDELLSKSIDDLLDIVAIAEKVTGSHIILTGDEPVTMPTARPNMREGSSFEPPDTNAMMNDSVNALNEAMAKHGKKVPTLKEKKREDLGADLTDLQRQMKELQGL